VVLFSRGNGTDPEESSDEVPASELSAFGARRIAISVMGADHQGLSTSKKSEVVHRVKQNAGKRKKIRICRYARKERKKTVTIAVKRSLNPSPL